MSNVIRLSNQNPLTTERLLYLYSGYYLYNKNKSVRVYIKVDDKNYDYGERNAFPDKITMPTKTIIKQRTDNMIILDLNRKTVKTGDIPLDNELLNLLHKLTEELQGKENNNIHFRKRKLMCKIQEYNKQTAYKPNTTALPDFTEGEIKLLMSCFYDNTTYDEMYSE